MAFDAPRQHERSSPGSGITDHEERALREMDYADRQDADDIQVVWDNDAFAFLAGDCPPTAHPSLWR